MSRPAAVLFDLYGTLADIEVDERRDAFWVALAREALPAVQIDPLQLREIYFGLLAQERLQGGKDGFLLTSTFERLLRLLKQKQTDMAVVEFADHFRRLSILSLKARSYAAPLLRLLRSEGFSLGLISNTEALLTQFDLKVLRLEDAFNTILLSSQVGAGKPDSLIYRIALENLRVDACEAIMIGDTYETDVVGAESLSINSIYLTSDESISIEVRTNGIKVLPACPNYDSIVSALNNLDCRLPLGPQE